MSEYDFIDFSNSNSNSNANNLIIDKHIVVIFITLFTGYFALFVFNRMLNSDCFNE